ncbi:cyclin-T1 isoform X2 [Folsomia candida]|uniref:Cyclin-T1 n=1 Tax=Folsomia candida TaxID=158441 RepID=A0A226ELH0_FOLCA|nr:cyclin-T1 isoform X2 [Folsomia candida]OXA58309.1 Cyclin-T1 [Folsomia candida]
MSSSSHNVVVCGAKQGPVANLEPLPPAVPVISGRSSGGSSCLMNIAAISISADEERPRPPNPGKWYFTKAQINDTPSRRLGMSWKTEIELRQGGACFIQKLGNKLQVNQICNDTAIVFMHRFYMCHPFEHFPVESISIATIFVAAKLEEQPRKMEHVIKVAHSILLNKGSVVTQTAETYRKMCEDLCTNENIILMTLGFDFTVDHARTHVIQACKLVRASKELGTASFSLVTKLLLMTTMCVQYRPTLIAALAIYVACKWSGWQISRSKEGRDWWLYIDPRCTQPDLEKLTHEFLHVYDRVSPVMRQRVENLTQICKSEGDSPNQNSQRSESGSSQNSQGRKRTALAACLVNPPSEPLGKSASVATSSFTSAASYNFNK